MQAIRKLKWNTTVRVEFHFGRSFDLNGMDLETKKQGGVNMDQSVVPFCILCFVVSTNLKVSSTEGGFGSGEPT